MMKYTIEETVVYEIEARSAQEAMDRFLGAPDVCAFSTEVSGRTIWNGRWQRMDVKEEGYEDRNVRRLKKRRVS